MLVSTVTEQPHTALMNGFCSLGDNCEFGMAQRAYGAEPADLLRWAAIDSVALIDLLRNGCAGIGDPAQLRAGDVHGFFWIDHTGYRFGWHSLVRTGAMPPADILQREILRMPRLAQALLDDLGSGERIFVIKHHARDITGAEAEAVHEAMREYGGAALLYVTRADAAHPCGSVEMVAPGLMHGYLARFSGMDNVARDTPSELWLRLCQNAAALAGHGGC